MSLDAQTRSLLDQVNGKGNAKLFELSVADARAGLKEMTLAMDAPESTISKCEERLIVGPNGEIPVRIYWPLNQSSEKALPLLILYHGGGFALGDMETHENMARYFCEHASVIVVNVGYRLSPEHQFPKGVEDCYAVLCWVAESAQSLKGDPGHISVTGDSAGGNLSAVMCQLARDRCGPEIASQVLMYPSVTMALDADYESRRQFESGYFLGLEDMSWMSGMYFDNQELQSKDISASPILAKNLSDLPPALIITAGHDPLRDEGKHYAERLESAGVQVEYRCFESTIHGFMSFAGLLDVGKEGLSLVCQYLKKSQ